MDTNEELLEWDVGSARDALYREIREASAGKAIGGREQHKPITLDGKANPHKTATTARKTSPNRLKYATDYSKWDSICSDDSDSDVEPVTRASASHGRGETASSRTEARRQSSAPLRALSPDRIPNAQGGPLGSVQVRGAHVSGPGALGAEADDRRMMVPRPQGRSAVPAESTGRDEVSSSVSDHPSTALQGPCPRLTDSAAYESVAPLYMPEKYTSPMESVRKSLGLPAVPRLDSRGHKQEAQRPQQLKRGFLSDAETGALYDEQVTQPPVPDSGRSVAENLKSVFDWLKGALRGSETVTQERVTEILKLLRAQGGGTELLSLRIGVILWWESVKSLLMMHWAEVCTEGRNGKQNIGRNAPPLEEEADEIRQLLQKSMDKLAAELHGQCLEAAGELEAKLHREPPPEWEYSVWTDTHNICQLCLAFCHMIQGNGPQAMFHIDMAFATGAPGELVQMFLNYLDPKSRRWPTTRHPRATSAYLVPDEEPRDLLLAAENLPTITLKGKEVQRGPIPKPSIQWFKETCFLPQTPYILTGLPDDWPGIRDWRDLRWWLDRFGHRVVAVELGRPKHMGGGGVRRRMATIACFVNCHMVPRQFRDPRIVQESFESSRRATSASPGSNGEHLWWQLQEQEVNLVGCIDQSGLTEQFPELKQYYAAPEYLQLGTLNNVNLCLSPMGVVSPLHREEQDILFVQVAGYTYARLYAPTQSRFLYQQGKGASKGTAEKHQGNVSVVNVEEPGDEHPLFEQAEYSETILGPGDTLYIPRDYWHYVRSLTTSISLIFSWDRNEGGGA
eukprot:scaffold1558_cov403-Prasinococcus_capsulatus_cf.AAC.40